MCNVDKKTVCILNESLAYTFIELREKGVDVSRLMNKMCVVSDVNILSALRYGRCCNPIEVAQDILYESIVRPYFFFTFVDRNLTFTPETLAFIYCAVNRIPCVLEYPSLLKEDVSKFVTAIINWFDLLYNESPICKIIDSLEDRLDDPMFYSIMRRPGNIYITANHLNTKCDFLSEYGLIVMENLHNNRRSSQEVLDLINKPFSENVMHDACRRIATVDSSKFSCDGIEWTSNMFDMNRFDILRKLSESNKKYIVIKIK